MDATSTMLQEGPSSSGGIRDGWEAFDQWQSSAQPSSLGPAKIACAELGGKTASEGTRATSRAQAHTDHSQIQGEGGADASVSNVQKEQGGQVMKATKKRAAANREGRLCLHPTERN